MQVDPFELHINDGMMEGVIIGGTTPEGRFKMSNFDAEILTQFLKDEYLKFSGLIFGEIWIQSTGNELDLDADLSLKRGMYMSEPFDEMVLSCLYKNGMLHLDDISMTREGSMGLQANGIIPFRQSQTGHSSISLKSSFSNLSMEFIHRFIPKFFTLKGSTSGFLHLKGTPEKTQFKYNLEINELLFDVVALGHFTSKGKYDGRKLFVESAKSVRDDGTITGYGYLPFDFNLGSAGFGQFFTYDSINFHAQAHLGSLPFLSPYLSDLDSARGNFDISLSLSGPIEQIQRSGYLNIRNGKLYTLLISDPITAIDGAATMKNNQLVIQDLIAMLYHPNGKYPKPRKQNVSIMGSVDFSKFFNPGYNLQIKGEEASYRLLALDISGQSNLNVTISGKDTVSIAGTIETQDANVFYEFTTEDVGTALPEESEIVMAYNLNIPIRGTALFQNSQIDAQVTGELSLTQMGHQEIDFGGQIIVDDGSVFSYKDNFEDLQIGAKQTLHHIQYERMTGIFAEHSVMLRQVPDLAHVVEAHRVLPHVSIRNARFDLHILLRKLHDLIADIFQPLMQRLDFEGRQQLVHRQKTQLLELVYILLCQLHADSSSDIFAVQRTPVAFPMNQLGEGSGPLAFIFSSISVFTLA